MFQQLSSLALRVGWTTTWCGLPQNHLSPYKFFIWKNTEFNEFVNCLIILKLKKITRFKVFIELCWRLKSYYLEYLVYFSLYSKLNLLKFKSKTILWKKLKLKLTVLRKFKIKTYVVKKVKEAISPSLFQKFKEKNIISYASKLLCQKSYIKKRFHIITYSVRFWFSARLISLFIQLHFFKQRRLKFIVFKVLRRLLYQKKVKQVTRVFLTSFGFFQYKLIGFYFRFSGKAGFSVRNRLSKTKLFTYGKVGKKSLNFLNDVYQIPIVTKQGVFGVTVCLA